MKPKFRAWDIHEKKMITNEQIIIWNNNVYANDVGKLKPDRLMGWNIDDKYLMQSTGMFDKNGVSIFEGDIVKTTRFFGIADEASGFYKELIGVVKQLEGTWAIDTGNNAVDLWSEIDENEVLGNIHEKPDLMEAENEQAY
ncbi:YopX family protein [Streptococcus pluranimalium]|uniref:YopX family protein n=1 Tax=Streptococcus pluranimalium TaxID=82348 RepID=UPI003F6922C7